jgi:hypothetical protein
MEKGGISMQPQAFDSTLQLGDVVPLRFDDGFSPQQVSTHRPSLQEAQDDAFVELQLQEKSDF